MSATRHDRGVGKFIDAVLSEFGTEWTQLTIVFGVVISVFRLDIEPGIWVIGTALSFLASYLIRRSISGRFVLTTALAVAIASLAFWALERFWSDISAGVSGSDRSVIWSLALSIIIALPIGISILSYRAQEHFRVVSLPRPLLAKMAEQVDHADLLFRDVCYVVKLEQPPALKKMSEVRVHFHMTFTMVNRRRDTRTFSVPIDPTHKRDVKFKHLRINGEPVDTSDNEIRSGIGLKPTVKLAAGEAAEFDFAVSAIQSEIGTEFYSIYGPADSMRIELKPAPSSLDVQVSKWTMLDMETEIDGDYRTFKFSEGVLPFQGIRLMWFPR